MLPRPPPRSSRRSRFSILRHVSRSLFQQAFWRRLRESRKLLSRFDHLLNFSLSTRSARSPSNRPKFYFDGNPSRICSIDPPVGFRYCFSCAHLAPRSSLFAPRFPLSDRKPIKSASSSDPTRAAVSSPSLFPLHSFLRCARHVDVGVLIITLFLLPLEIEIQLHSPAICGTAIPFKQLVRPRTARKFACLPLDRPPGFAESDHHFQRPPPTHCRPFENDCRCSLDSEPLCFSSMMCMSPFCLPFPESGSSDHTMPLSPFSQLIILSTCRRFFNSVSG